MARSRFPDAAGGTRAALRERDGWMACSSEPLVKAARMHRKALRNASESPAECVRKTRAGSQQACRPSLRAPNILSRAASGRAGGLSFRAPSHHSVDFVGRQPARKFEEPLFAGRYQLDAVTEPPFMPAVVPAMV